MTAFIMKLPYLTADGKNRLESWARHRCIPGTFLVVEELDIAGGVLIRAPQSLKHFQATMGNNLRNWKVERQICERGWLQFVSVDELSFHLGLVAASERRRQNYGEWLRNVAIPAEMQRRKDAWEAERNVSLQAAVQKLQAIVAKRTRGSFDILGAKVLEARGHLAEQRMEKRRLFDQDRFKRPDVSMTYSDAELDECDTWADVKRRRLATYAPWKLKEEEHLERIATQKADVARYS